MLGHIITNVNHCQLVRSLAGDGIDCIKGGGKRLHIDKTLHVDDKHALAVCFHDHTAVTGIAAGVVGRAQDIGAIVEKRVDAAFLPDVVAACDNVNA